MLNTNINHTYHDIIIILCISAIPIWPVTWKSKILLVSWAVFGLVIAYGEHDCILYTYWCLLITYHFVGYKGSLTAMLTYPVRSASIDSFANFLDLSEEATMYVPGSTSLIEVLQHSSDPIMQAFNDLLIKQICPHVHSSSQKNTLLTYYSFWISTANFVC